jgi:uncharacterized protein (DUF1330 family)
LGGCLKTTKLWAVYFCEVVGGTTMAAYLLAKIEEVTDAAGLGQYREQVAPLVAQYGGRYLAAGVAENKEGDWGPGVNVVIEFPSLERAREWYDCAEYRPLKELRQRSARVNLAFLDGM